MRNEGFDQELAENTSDGLNLNVLSSTSFNPLLGLRPRLVQGQETALAASLDQLVGFGDKLGTGSQQPRIDDLGLIEDILDGGIFGEVERGEPGSGIVSCGGRKRRGFDDRGASEVIIEDGLSIGLEDGLGGHDGRLGDGLG